MDVPLLNGIAPVNTYIDTEWQWAETLHRIHNPQRTSTMTIAKEKTSDSLVHGPSFKTSGAVHRAVRPCLCEALRMESKF